MSDRVYVGSYTPGSRWIPSVPVNQQPLMAEHGAQMRGLFTEGRNLLSGPFADLAGGMVIIRADSTEEAERLLTDGDAMVEEDVVRVEVRPWLVAFGAEALHRPREAAVR